MGNRIAYGFFLMMIGIMKITPFWVVYRISDFIYLLLCYLIRYRSEIIDKNLQKCFPEKDRKELIKIKRKFYRNLGDLIVESIKGYSMSKKQLLNRYRAYHAEISDNYYRMGKDVIIVSGHLGNWEWGAAPTAHYYLHKPVVLYKPLSNPFIDQFVRNRRARFGVELASIYKTSRYFIRKKEKPEAFYMVADQYYANLNRQIKVEFFNSITAFLDGPEKYSNLHNLPVVYLEIKRERRGYYSFKTYNITDNPQNLAKNELTQIYARLLEKSIRNQPEDWMWSHKRWKKELYAFD